jgi:hypothetical protein
MISITIDTKPVQEMFRRLTREQIPTAMRNTLNDTARDIAKGLNAETLRVFDRPTPLVQRAFAVDTKATKERLEAVVWIKDGYGKSGQDLINTLVPHIQGGGRKQKPMERRIRYPDATWWLVPSRTMKLDRYGNVPGSVASKMLSDIGVYSYQDAAGNTSKPGKAKYMWGSVTTRGGKKVSGVWDMAGLRSRKPGSLLMVAVGKAPTYRRRFDYDGITRRIASERLPFHARLALEHAIARSRSR